MPGLKVDREYGVMDGYEFVSYYSCDDSLWVASIPTFVGCAADGATREEAVSALSELKPEWIAAVTARGKAVPAPRHDPDRVLA